MATISFKKGLQASLPTTYSAGTFYVTTDERAMYLDISDSARIRIGDFQEFASLAALQANANPSTSALYYVADINCLAKFDGTNYVQINRDTGAVAFEVTGDGNVITDVSYDATTRKLTLTKGLTAATPDDVASAVNAKAGDLTYNETTYETIKEYVDAKTSGIATDAALGDLQARVTAAEGEIDVLQAIDHEAYKAADEQVLTDAKTYADGLNTAMDTRVKVLEAIDHEAYKAYADQAEADALAAAKEYADGLDGAMDTRVDGIETRVETVEGKVATLEGEMDSAEGRIKAIEDDYLKSTDKTELVSAIATAKSEAIAEAVETVLGENVSADFDTLQEVAAWIASDTTNSSALITRVSNIESDYLKGADKTELQGEIDALSAFIGDLPEGAVSTTVIAYIQEVVNGLSIGDYAKAADLTALAGRVTTVEGKVTTIEGKVSTLEGEMDAVESRAEVLEGKMTTVEGKVEVLEGKAHTHTFVESELNKIADGDVAKWNAAEQNAKDYADDLNEAMDGRVGVLEAIEHHEHSNKAELDLIESGDKAKWDAAAEKAHEHSNKGVLDGITEAKVSAWDAAQANAEATAKAYTDGISVTLSNADTTNLQAAKDYADSAVVTALTWGSF